MRTYRNGCEGCGSFEQVLQRTLEGTRHCATAGCLLKEFIREGRCQIERYHADKFPFLARIVTDPLDVPVIAAGDLLDVEGALRLGEIRKFLAINGGQHRNPDLQERWNRYVAVRLKATMVAMHEEDDPWARKIRGSVEQAVWKSKEIHRNPLLRQALYCRPADGDPMLGAEPMTMDQIVSGLFERKVRPVPISAFLSAVFDLLSGQDSCSRALSIAEMTRIVSMYHGTLYSGEPQDRQDDAPDTIDDDERRMIDNAAKLLIDGRLGFYFRQEIYTEAECKLIVSMTRGYLEDLLRRKSLPVKDRVRAVFPKDERRSRDPVELKRISNLLMFARHKMCRH
jgi:hypothetical protein